MSNPLYITQEQLVGQLPADFLEQALTDTEPEVPDEEVVGAEEPDTTIWDAVLATAVEQIHSRLAPRFVVPFPEPFPAAVMEAARVFVCEALYIRRDVTGKANPWTEQANRMRARLDDIGNGKAALAGAEPTAFAAGGVISEDLTTVPSVGKMLL